MKIVSWNVNGVRAVLKKGALQELLAQERPDALCVQETKAKPGQAEVDFAGYEEIWNSAERAGYAGTALFTGVKPLSVRFGMTEAQDGGAWADAFGDARKEGRVLTAEFAEFYLVNCYVPNAKEGLERLAYREKVWDPALLAYLKTLEQTKPVVVCGDFNVAHCEIDLARPQPNRGHAGFTDEERRGMDRYLAVGLHDVWRERNPGRKQYSWWSFRGNARANNTGWRIDYFLLSTVLLARVKRVEILDAVGGSDHCPLVLEIETAEEALRGAKRTNDASRGAKRMEGV